MRRQSLGSRVRSGFIWAAVIIGAALVGAGWWLAGIGRHIEAGLREDQESEALVSQFQSAVLRELEAGERYLVTLDPHHRLAFQRQGFEAFRLQQRILMRSDGSPEVSYALVQVLENLAVAEVALARAHRLMELGRTAEATDALQRSSLRTDSMLAGLEALSAAQAKQRQRAAHTLKQQVLARAVVVTGALAAGFAIAFVLSHGAVVRVVRSRERLSEHAEHLQSGDFTARTDPGSLPLELRSLAEALNEASDSLGQLREKEAALQRAEKLSAMGLLLAGVAHELNNPLAAILITSDALLEGSQSPEEGLAGIREQAQRSRAVVRRLLASVREDAGAAPGAVQPSEALVPLKPHIEAITAGANIELEWAIEADLPTVRGEAAGLRTVVEGLVENAIRAAGPGGRVRVLGGIAEDGGVKLAVEDNGEGIPPGIHSRIFDPFFTTRPTGEGAGLGLSVALAIVTGAGGSLIARNLSGGEGRGARFVVSLPAADAAAPAEAPGPRAAEQAADAPLPAAGNAADAPTILIVDDEAPIRTTLRKVFERRGWLVDEATDGADAFRRFEATGADAPYQVILTDLKMPVMTGMQLVDLLLDRDPALRNRLVIMTGDNLSPGPAEFIRRTDLPVVDKPFEIATLLRVVNGVASAAARS